MRVATADVRFHEIAHPGVERAVGPGEALVVDSEELLDVLFEDVLEPVGVGTGRVAAGAAWRGEDGHGQEATPLAAERREARAGPRRCRAARRAEGGQRQAQVE